MSLRSRLVSGGVWAIAGRGATIAAGLVINMLLTRLLTPAEFGAYILVLTIAGIAALIGQMGANHAALRIASGLMSEGRTGKAKSVVSRSFAIAAFGLTVCGIILVAIGGWVGVRIFDSQEIGRVAGSMALVAVVSGWQATLSDAYRAYQDIRAAVIYGGVLSSLMFLLFIAAFYSLHIAVDLNKVLLAFVVAYTLVLLFGTVFLGRRMDERGGAQATTTVQEVLTVAVPLMLPNIVTILFQLDTWILGVYRPEAEVAVYGAAAKVAFVISAPLMVVNFAVVPFISELYARKDLKGLERLLRGSATVATVPALLLFVAFMFWKQSLLGNLFGNFYQSGGTLLIVLGMSQLVVSWTGSCGNTLLMIGKKRLLAGIYAVAGVVLVVTSMALVATHGALGVAVGYLVGTAILNVGAWVMVKKSLGIYSHAYLVPGREFLKDIQRAAS